jgi:hypothetical protein
MANPHRGEVRLSADGEDYTLSLSINAMCELEELLGEPIAKTAMGLSAVETMKMTTVRAMLWAALRDHHPQVNIVDAGDIAAKAGITEAVKKIGEAFNLAFPQEQAKGNPRRAAKG